MLYKYALAAAIYWTVADILYTQPSTTPVAHRERVVELIAVVRDPGALEICGKRFRVQKINNVRAAPYVTYTLL